MKISSELRAALKEPLGELLLEANLKKSHILERISRPIITVGDRTTERLLEWGITVDLQIVDGLERRERRRAPSLPEGTIEVRCSNPPGAISQDADRSVREALQSGRPSRVLVDGEEDLLVLPACIYAPDGASLFYGQPGKGMVSVRVGPEARRKTQKIIKAMQGGE